MPGQYRHRADNSVPLCGSEPESHQHQNKQMDFLTTSVAHISRIFSSPYTQMDFLFCFLGPGGKPTDVFLHQ